MAVYPLDKSFTPEAEAHAMAVRCLKRGLQRMEMAKFVALLASEEASACTSQHYVVDGGWA